MPTEEFRRDLMTEMGDLGHGVGLEIGPLNRPVALKATCDVRYVDVFDSPTTRAHYKDDPNVNVDDIPDLDFCLHTADGTLQTLFEAVKADAPYRWVLASHVVEHVPDLIGWLNEVASVLDDGGVLVLAVPDRRYTFDVMRPATTVGQVLQAYTDQDMRPSVRAVYDHFRSHVNFSAHDLWSGESATEANRGYTLDDTLHQLEMARDEGRYIDSHVWLFTPASFVEQLVELGRLKLVDFYVDQVIPTDPYELEFYVTLKRLPRDCSAEIATELRARGDITVVDNVLPQPESEPEPAPEPEPIPEPAPEPEPEPVEPRFPVSDREIRLIETKRKVINTLLRRPKPPVS